MTEDPFETQAGESQDRPEPGGQDPRGPRLNPWLYIWTRPRDTIQQIVDTDPERLVPILAAWAGVQSSLSNAAMRGAGDELGLGTILAVALIAGPIGGIISVWLGGWLIRVTGRWLDGNATPEQMRAALAWSNVPVIAALPLWIPNLLVFGHDVFRSEFPQGIEDPSLLTMIVGLGLVEFVLGVWTIVLVLKCVGQVQGFSAWKALGNVLLAVLLVALVLGSIFMVIGVLAG